jgi:hypothetical protein
MKFFAKIETAESRYDICKKCDKLNTFKFCKECKCFMPAKTKLLNASCPLKKWKSPFTDWM